MENSALENSEVGVELPLLRHLRIGGNCLFGSEFSTYEIDSATKGIHVFTSSLVKSPKPSCLTFFVFFVFFRVFSPS